MPRSALLPARRAVGKAERDELRRMVLAADRYDDELTAFVHVGHRRAGGAGGELGLPDHLAGGLVVGAKRVAERILRHAGNRVAAFADEEQRPGDERRRPAGGAERREVEPFQRRMVARSVAVRDLPRDFAATEIDGREA